MSTNRRRTAFAGALTAMLLGGLLAITTPVFAGSTGTHGSGHTAKLTLAISPSRSRNPPALAGGAVSATPLRHGSGRASRPGSTAFLDVVLAIAGRPHPSALPARQRKAGSPGSRPASSGTPVAVTIARLRAIAASAKHRIYWAGTARGSYELTTLGAGATYIRYLPPGVPVGSPHGYLTIGTLTRRASPYEAARRAALARRSMIRTLKGGGLAIQYSSTPHDVYLVFPHARYEVQIYDPAAGKALSLATSGKIIPLS